MTLRERVIQRMQKLGYNPSSLARRLEAQQSTVYSLVSGRTKSFRNMALLAQALETTAEWLLTGTGNEDMDLQPKVVDAMAVKLGPEIPLYGGPAPKTKEAIIMGYGKEIGTWPAIPTQAKMKDCFVVKACGDSMAPRYRQGEPAYAIRNMPAAEGQDCIVELKNGEGYLKIFKERTAHEIICIQLNPKKECRYKIEEVNAVHAVVR